MRLGGPVFEEYHNPNEWVTQVKALGYRATVCPVELDAPLDEIQAYAQAAKDADIIIAEVGGWSNPISPDKGTREAALEKNKKALELAERIGALCCVNIAGSRGDVWDGPHALNFTPETFDLIVETTRDIIDSVNPQNASYALETMPWMYPDSADSYYDLLKAIDRPAFAVHFDPVNMIYSPQRYFGNAAVIEEFVAKLGPYIKCCHAKDIILREQLTVHLDEILPGQGNLDYKTLLHALDKLPRDIPVILEHLPTAEDYAAAAAHVRQVAKEEGLTL